MKRKIYLLSPFCLSEFPLNWKVYYCVELFSALSRKGYIIHWIQPGKSIFNISLFPTLSKWRNFLMVNIGNSITYQWLMPFFLSRLAQVSQEKPLILIEIIERAPFNLDIDKHFCVIPLIFSLDSRWVASEDFPGPVIVPQSDTVQHLISSGVPPKFLHYIPIGAHAFDIQMEMEEDENIKVVLFDFKSRLKSLANEIKQKKPMWDVIYIDKKRLFQINPDEFHKWFQGTITGKNTISVLDTYMPHIGSELLARGKPIILWKHSEVLEDEYRGKIYYCDDSNDVINQIDDIIHSKINDSYLNKSKIPSWEDLGTQLEKIITEYVNCLYS